MTSLSPLTWKALMKTRRPLRSELRQAFKRLPKDILAKTNWPQFLAFQRRREQRERAASAKSQKEPDE